MSSTSNRSVLVVDDHRPTARLLCTAFAEVNRTISTIVVHDGRECLDSLRETDPLVNPALIILDLELPHLDGFAVLDERRTDPALRRIPTIVFSGSDDHSTMTRSYDKGANAFVSKPTDFDEYVSIAQSITDFWFCTARLPTH